MAWTSPRTWVAAELVSASLLNTHLRDNLDVLRAGGLALSSQAALDYVYASSTTQLGRVAVGSKYTVPRVNSGASAYEFAGPDWTLDVNDTQQATTSGADMVLYTYTVPANLLNTTGRGLRITAFGTYAANANSKIVRIRWGGIGGTTAALVSTTSASAAAWSLSALIYRIGSNSQRVVSVCEFQTFQEVSWTPAVTTAAQTESGTIDLVVTGDGGSASDIVFEGAVVSMFGPAAA